MLEFFKLQRPVIHGRRQAEPKLHQCGFARTVAPVHGAQLPHGDMAFIDKHQGIGGQIVDQRGRRLARRRTRQMPRIVFDALTKAQLLQHLEIKTGALLQALGLDQLVVGHQLGKALAQFLFDRFDRPQYGFARGHIMRTREHSKAGHGVPHLAGKGIEHIQRFDFVVEHGDAQRQLGMFCGEYVDDLATGTKMPAGKLYIVALVLHGNQPAQEFLAGMRSPVRKVSTMAW